MKHAGHARLFGIAAFLALSTVGSRIAAGGTDSAGLGMIRQELAGAEIAGSVRLPFLAPELVDPRSLLPDLSDYPLAELAALFQYARSCSDEDLIELRHPALTKALVWHRFVCNDQILPPGFFDTDPPFHPGGSSFVALAAGSGRARFGTNWLQARAHRLHVLETSRPAFAFGDFRTPEYKPFERRSLWFSLSHRSDSRPFQTHWEMSPTRTGFEAKEAMPDGDYTLGLFYSEARRFGPIVIGRSAGTITPFTIRKGDRFISK